MGVFSNNDNRPPSSAETILHGEESSYDECLDVYLSSSVVHACERANGKPNDAQQKKVATQMAFSLSQQLKVVSSLTSSAFEIVSSMCDIDAITQKEAKTTRKVTPTNL